MPHSEGWVNVDINRGPDVDLLMDCNVKWPFPSDYFVETRAFHVLEHLSDLNLVMKEAHRTLKPNSIFEIRVPFGPRGTFQNDDPNHVREFYPTTLAYYLRGNDGNTTLECNWEKPLFNMELCEVVRIFWQRGRLEPWVGKWISKRYTWPKIGIPVEIHWLLKKV